MATQKKITKKELMTDLKKKGLKLPHGYKIVKRKTKAKK